MRKIHFVRLACGAFLFCAAATMTLTAQTLTTLVSFDGTDGEEPYFAPLVQNTNGNIYGTTLVGGVNGAGTIFQITPEGAFSTFYNFCSVINCADGLVPYSGLTHDSDDARQAIWR